MRLSVAASRVLLSGLLLGLLVAPASPAAAQAARSGADVYTTCVACHMANGAGVTGVFPPLAGSEWVTGRAEIPIAIVLHGLYGEVTVDGDTYNNVMTPWGAMFSDEEIANVVTYIRTQFGNKASAVLPADVARVRAEQKARAQAWTAEELLKAYPARP